MAINDTLELMVRGTVNDTMHIHTLHFRSQGVGDAGGALAASWQTSAMTAYRACFPSGQSPVQLIRAKVICGALPLPAPVEVVPAGPSQLGTTTETGDLMPAFMASVTAVKGTLQGRTHSGRFFLGGLLETDNARNTLTAGYLARVQAYIDALKAAYVTGTPPLFQLVVHSRKTALIPGTDCLVSSSPVSNLVVSVRPTTMRSRKVGHGP